MRMIFKPKANWRPRPEWSGIGPSKWYSWGNCRVLCGLEPAGWHMSISCPDRNPTWEEIKQARYDLCPADVTMAMILPPKEEYVNIHEYCFHLHQIDGDSDDTH